MQSMAASTQRRQLLDYSSQKSSATENPVTTSSTEIQEKREQLESEMFSFKDAYRRHNHFLLNNTAVLETDEEHLARFKKLQKLNNPSAVFDGSDAGNHHQINNNGTSSSSSVSSQIKERFQRHMKMLHPFGNPILRSAYRKPVVGSPMRKMEVPVVSVHDAVQSVKLRTYGETLKKRRNQAVLEDAFYPQRGEESQKASSSITKKTSHEGQREEIFFVKGVDDVEPLPYHPPIQALSVSKKKMLSAAARKARIEQEKNLSGSKIFHPPRPSSASAATATKISFPTTKISSASRAFYHMENRFHSRPVFAVTKPGSFDVAMGVAHSSHQLGAAPRGVLGQSSSLDGQKHQEQQQHPFMKDLQFEREWNWIEKGQDDQDADDDEGIMNFYEEREECTTEDAEEEGKNIVSSLHQGSTIVKDENDKKVQKHYPSSNDPTIEREKEAEENDDATMTNEIDQTRGIRRPNTAKGMMASKSFPAANVEVKNHRQPVYQYMQYLDHVPTFQDVQVQQALKAILGEDDHDQTPDSNMLLMVERAKRGDGVTRQRRPHTAAAKTSPFRKRHLVESPQKILSETSKSEEEEEKDEKKKNVTDMSNFSGSKSHKSRQTLSLSPAHPSFFDDDILTEESPFKMSDETLGEIALPESLLKLVLQDVRKKKMMISTAAEKMKKDGGEVEAKNVLSGTTANKLSRPASAQHYVISSPTHSVERPRSALIRTPVSSEIEFVDGSGFQIVRDPSPTSTEMILSDSSQKEKSMKTVDAETKISEKCEPCKRGSPILAPFSSKPVLIDDEELAKVIPNAMLDKHKQMAATDESALDFYSCEGIGEIIMARRRQAIELARKRRKEQIEAEKKRKREARQQKKLKEAKGEVLETKSKDQMDVGKTQEPEQRTHPIFNRRRSSAVFTGELILSSPTKSPLRSSDRGGEKTSDSLVGGSGGGLETKKSFHSSHSLPMLRRQSTIVRDTSHRSAADPMYAQVICQSLYPERKPQEKRLINVSSKKEESNNDGTGVVEGKSETPRQQGKKRQPANLFEGQKEAEEDVEEDGEKKKTVGRKQSSLKLNKVQSVIARIRSTASMRSTASGNSTTSGIDPLRLGDEGYCAISLTAAASIDAAERMRLLNAIGSQITGGIKIVPPPQYIQQLQQKALLSTPATSKEEQDGGNTKSTTEKALTDAERAILREIEEKRKAAEEKEEAEMEDLLGLLDHELDEDGNPIRPPKDTADEEGSLNYLDQTQRGAGASDAAADQAATEEKIQEAVSNMTPSKKPNESAAERLRRSLEVLRAPEDRLEEKTTKGKSRLIRDLDSTVRQRVIEDRTRVAILIAVSNYADPRIIHDEQPVFDVKDLEKILKELNFLVILMSPMEEDPSLQPTKKNILATIAQHTKKLSSAESLCFVVFLGGGFHGVFENNVASSSPVSENENIGSSSPHLFSPPHEVAMGGSTTKQRASSISSSPMTPTPSSASLWSSGSPWGSPMPDATTNSSSAFRANMACLPMECTINNISKETTISIQELAATGNKQGGPQNIVFMDTFSVMGLSPCDRNVGGFALAGGRQCIGSDITCIYPPQLRLLFTFYLKRALQGFATRDSRVTINSMNTYISDKLKLYGGQVETTSSSLFIGDVIVAKVQELTFSRKQIRDLKTLTHKNIAKLSMTVIPLRNQDPSSNEFVSAFQTKFLKSLRATPTNCMLRCYSRIYSHWIHCFMRSTLSEPLLLTPERYESHVSEVATTLDKKYEDPSIQYNLVCRHVVACGAIYIPNRISRDTLFYQYFQGKKTATMAELKAKAEEEARIKAAGPKLFGSLTASLAVSRNSSSGDSHLASPDASGSKGKAPSPKTAKSKPPPSSKKPSTTENTPQRTMESSGRKRHDSFVMSESQFFQQEEEIQKEEEQRRSKPFRNPGFFGDIITSGFQLQGQPVHEIGQQVTISFLTTEYLSKKLDRCLRIGTVALDFAVLGLQTTVLDDECLKQEEHCTKVQAHYRGYRTRRLFNDILLPHMRQQRDERENIIRLYNLGYDFLLKAQHVGAQMISANLESECRQSLIEWQCDEVRVFYRKCLISWEGLEAVMRKEYVFPHLWKRHEFIVGEELRDRLKTETFMLGCLIFWRQAAKVLTKEDIQRGVIKGEEHQAYLNIRGKYRWGKGDG